MGKAASGGGELIVFCPPGGAGPAHIVALGAIGAVGVAGHSVPEACEDVSDEGEGTGQQGCR
jgi:succinyl-CoA synthetase alpha subunit